MTTTLTLKGSAFPTKTTLCSCSCKSQKEKQKKRVTMHCGNWTGSCVVIVIGPPNVAIFRTERKPQFNAIHREYLLFY
uniref:Uncharacterized protein n=1 Tax=Oryza glumipatula TaxID=40148 RepID=A0A0E0BDY3_9ORYZ